MDRRGFTLLEILVVLAIVGISLAMVTVNFGASDKQTLMAQAHRLASLLELAGSEAMITGEVTGWSAENGKYQFWRLNDDGKWTKYDDDLLSEGRLDGGVVITGMEINRKPVRPGQKLVFSPTGSGAPFKLALALNDAVTVLSYDALGRATVEEGFAK